MSDMELHARQAAELLNSEAWKRVRKEYEADLMGRWTREENPSEREKLWQSVQGLYALHGMLDAEASAPQIAEVTEKRLSFDQRI
jgi:hypothetical protein